MTSSSNLHLSFESNDTGATILRVKQQQPPWRVVRGFRAASGETLAHVHNLSGGILDTDSLSWQVDVGPRAQAQVTSTGATRVYRSRSPGSRASQRASVNIAADAYLEYLPDQLIPFAGSRFDQTARVEIERGGSLIWWDRVAPGREASDEIFRFESLTSHFELIADGQPIAIERWTLDAAYRTPGFHRAARAVSTFRFLLRVPRRRASQLLEEFRIAACKPWRINFRALKYYGE